MEELDSGNNEILEHVNDPFTLLKLNEKLSDQILLSHNVGYRKIDNWVETIDALLN